MVEEAAAEGPERSKPLDDPSLYPKIDSTGLRHRLRHFPVQCREAWDQALAFDLPAEYTGIERVLVSGMGGSAIGGDLLADLASLEDSPPIAVSRDYRITDYVSEGTLVFACSYSGETEETLSSFRQALAQGAKVIAVTGGGTLAAEAQEHNVPLFRVGYAGEPRSALGYSFIVPAVLSMKLGVISDKTRDFEEATKTLDTLLAELAEESPSRSNPAKQISAEALGRLIVIYGAGIFGSVARRWKTQLNENSKAWAFFELLPEAHHNSVVGYALPDEVKGRAFVILLRPGYLHTRTHLRYEITRELLERESIPHRVLEGRGESVLSHMLSAILLGDYVSYYLALLQGVDPSPVPVIDFIKGRLADAG